jgi:LAO/AO transport system kinase
MATRGSLGGLAISTREVCDVLDAAGFDRILIETVGVGQSELDVARMADTTVLTLVPESGDGIQTLKSGVMEIADIFVVNKADRPGAAKLQNEIDVTLGIRKGNAFRRMKAHHGVSLRTAGAVSLPVESSDKPAWEHPVLLVSASLGEGIPPVMEAIDRHWTFMGESGELDDRRRRRLMVRTREVIGRAVDRWLWKESDVETTIAARLDEMIAGRVSPYAVAAAVVAGIREGAAARGAS